jgi:integrase/recombinase XerD
MSGRYEELKTVYEFPSGEKWLKEQKVKNSKQNAKQKRIALEQFDAFLYENGINLDAVGDITLYEFSIWLDEEAGLAHSTLSHRWYAIRSYLNRHVDENVGHIDANDSRFDGDYILDWLDSGTQTTQENDLDVHWIPQDKIQDLIGGAKNLKNRLIIELLWNTGCRPSEVARMKLRRVDRDNRTIKVRTSKVSDSDADNYERYVFYSRSMRSTMREWLDRGGRAQYTHSENSGRLIVGYNTPQVSARQINKIVRMAADEAGIQEDMIQRADDVSNNRVTPKTLRHSFAVHSVRGRDKSGTPPIDIERLRRIMGHSSLDITRQYLKYRTSDLQTAYDQSFPA